MKDTATLLIDGQCALGEGPLWHPERQELFWFDINNKALFAAKADGTAAGEWRFDETAGALGIIGGDEVAIFTETGLKRFNLATKAMTPIVAIEENVLTNRCNDSRVHPSGAFWLGTMSKAESENSGAVYHYLEGKLTRIISDINIPNATCFSPDGRTAYWTDTPTKKILKCATDPDTGMPNGEWTLFADIEGHRGYPDGAVVDSEGYLWNARWGGSCVVRHAPDGSVDRIIEVPVSLVTCPAFGGADLKTLFITTANKILTPEEKAKEKVAGGVFAIELDVAGQAETPVRL